MAIVGIISLLVIAIAVGIWGYTIYNDGTLLDKPLELICGDAVCEAQSCTNECNKVCPNVVCGDCNFPEELEIVYKNETE